MRRLVPLMVATAAGLVVACTDVGTDPNAVVAIRFDGSAYLSIVGGDSLRDSLGALQPLRATALNYKGDSVAGATFSFFSPDTVLRVGADGNVFATRRRTDANPARVYASIGSLQSQPDTLFVVPRADSIGAAKTVDTVRIAGGLGSNIDTPSAFTVRGDTLAGAPKAPVQGWLVSFQLLYRDGLLDPTDTTKAYTFVKVGSGATTRLKPTFVDTSDASGTVSRSIFVKGISTSAAEDTIFLIATAWPRKLNADPLRDTLMIIIRP